MRISLITILLFVAQLLNSQILTQSNLAIVVITTEEAILDEPKVRGHMGIIFNGEGQTNHVWDSYNAYDGFIGIEFRGQSSLALFDKKGYGIETRNADGSNNNVSFLNFPEENDWVFHGPYSDKTLMRNALAYLLANDIMVYAPRVRFIELIINDDYQGVYLLTEKIKKDKDRVDIADLNDTDISGDELTGGYILKIDKASGPAFNDGFESSYKPFSGAWQTTSFLYHYPKPDDITFEQKQYIKNHIDQFEDLMKSDLYDDPNLGYPNWIDVESFIDFFIINELTKNPDAYRLSTYFHKDKDSNDPRIKMGPVWDFNLGLGNVDYCTGGSHTGFVATSFNSLCGDDFWVIHFWWERLLRDPNFIEGIKSRWEELRAGVFSNERLVARIDSMENHLSQAQIRNFQRYPILENYIWPNYTVEGSYSGEVQRLRNWIVSRAEWIDENLNILNNTAYNSQWIIAPKMYPNPIDDNSVIEHYSHVNANITLSIWNTSGQLMDFRHPKNTISGFNKIPLPSELSKGSYIYRLDINDKSHYGKFIKL